MSARRPTVAVVGASANRNKFGNKSVRAHLKAGYDVFPIHPAAALVEGQKVYRGVREVPVPLDRVTLYVPPEQGLKIIEDIARVKPKELFFNPGSESPELIEKAKQLGLTPLLACSIVDVGFHPAEF